MNDWKRPATGMFPRTILVLGCLLVFAWAHALPAKKPAPGVLLVAAEQMLDPHFQGAVVLLIEHNQNGTWGLVINKPTDIEVRDLFPAKERLKDASNIYFGGPVHLERLVFLYQDLDSGRPDEGLPGLPGLHWSDSRDTLEQRLEKKPDRLRVYAGYTGWAPGQLAFEIARGDWKLIQGKEGDIFNADPAQLWESLTGQLSSIAI